MKRFAIAMAVLLLVAGIAVGQDLDALKKKISRAASAGNWDEFTSGIRELGSIDSAEGAKAVLKMAFVLDKQQISDATKADTFEAAKSALKRMNSAEAQAYMREQMVKNRSWEVRRILAEILGEKGGEENRLALCDLIRKERSSEVLREAVSWLKQIGSYESVDALIELLAKVESQRGLLWVEVRKALTALTSADYESAQKWEEYWRVRKDELKANPGSPETAGPSPPGDVRTGLNEELKKAPKFFGREILSKRFCFVIDVSGSMAEMDTYSGGGGEGGGGGKPVEAMRIKMVKDQLIKLIAALDPKTKFNIIAFSLSVSTWQKQQLVSATSKNKKAAIEFVKKFNPFGTTHTDAGLKEAFANKEADTIVLLTDGAPTHSGRYDDSTNLISSIFEFVRNANRSRKVTIDTFGFESVVGKHQAAGAGQSTQQFLDFLKKLAGENRGKFTNIK